jgi:CRP-like cAMP-binding protein
MQGEQSDAVMLLLDGMVAISVDGVVVAEAAPGAIIGERAAIEGGVRTSTVTAVTDVRVAVARRGSLDAGSLGEVAVHHRRENA